MWKEAIVFLPEKDLEKIDDILAEISPEKEKEMRKNCLKLYNYFKANYANNSDKIIVHYCCGSYDGGDVGGVARYDYHIKCTFPQRIFVKQKDPKLLELCKKYGSRLIVITDNHLACDVPNDITTYLVHHGVAQTHADRDPAWTGFWKNLCCSGQKKMCGYRNPDTTKIISISQFCTDEFTKYYGKTYTRFRNTKILHASELDENRYVTDFNQKPKVLGNWNCVNKGKDIISKIIGIENKFMFNHLQIRILNGDIADFNRRKQDIYLNNDIFLNLSLCEGFSYAALDAVLCGLPLVSTKVGFCYKDMPEHCFVPLEIDRISDCDYVISKLNYAWKNKETIGRKGREWYMKNCRFSDWKNKMIHTILNQKSHKNITYSSNILDSNEMIKKLIQKNEPFSISRLGCAISAISRIYLEKDIIDNYQKKLIQSHDGIYCNNDEDIIKYIQYYTNAIKNSDFLASFPNLYVREQNYFIDKYSLKTLHNRVLEPFHIEKDPWSLYLSGKKVLVINPFVESFKKQMQSGFRIFKDKDIFKKDQEFVYYKPFNCLAGNRPHKNWFETFEIMCKDIKEIEFDIALLGCGGYGLPLCEYIKNDLKKSAIYVGGGLQLLFGVMGGRWEKNKMWEKIIRENDSKFIRPSGEEIIKGNEHIENSCYW